MDTLDLSENLLNLVPNAALIAMENLAYLDLSSNPIKTIGKTCIKIDFNSKCSRHYSVANYLAVVFNTKN